jgi:general secretion pathway protein B
MSSILKALKKLEHEKTSRFPDSLKIDSDILKGTDSTRSFSPFALVLLLLLVFGGGAAVAFFFMKETKKPTATKPQQVITAKSLQSPVSAPVVNTETLPVEIVVVPARREPSGKSSRKQQQKTAAAGNAADSIVKKPTREAVSGISKKPVEATEIVKKELPAAAIIPTLRVNGIAFQNSRADSMAIVNGIPVSSGSIIEGITVEEILNDRVKFQLNGEKFEIRLGQSNR